jgi:[ribosomal protein S5]-alanine N-acetyltransferase
MRILSMKYDLFGQKTERLTFRKLIDSDFEACLEFFLDPRSNRYWKSEIVDPAALALEWFEKQQERYQNNRGAINALISKQTNQLMGWCGLILQTVDEKEELEVAYSIIPNYWNNGYATEAAKRCIDFAFENLLSDSIISIIHVDNTESRNVALKNGLTIEKTTVYHGNPVNIFKKNLRYK